MEKLEKQIQKLELELDTFRKTEKRLKRLEEQLKHEQLKKEALDKKTEKEYQDIVELKKKSIIDIFVDLQEEKEKKLAKEQEEYHQALLAFKKQEKAIEAILFEINILKEKLKKYPEKKRELALLLQKKPVAPLEPEQKKKLKALEKTTIQNNKIRQSIHRAINGITNQQVLLAEISDSLKKINTWGLWNLPEYEKNKIFRTEFGRIFKAFDDQQAEMSDYKSELEHLWSLETKVAPDFQAEYKHLDAAWQKLERIVEFFAEYIMTRNLSSWGFRQQIVQISAKIKNLDIEMDQEILLLKQKEAIVETKLKDLKILKQQILQSR